MDGDGGIFSGLVSFLGVKFTISVWSISSMIRHSNWSLFPCKLFYSNTLILNVLLG